MELANMIQRLGTIYELMVQNSNDSIIALDLDYKVVSINQAGKRMFGYLEEEIVGQEVFLIIPPELIPKTKANFEWVKADKEVCHLMLNVSGRMVVSLRFRVGFHPLKIIMVKLLA